MGLGSSSTRKINIENPEPRPNTSSNTEAKDIPIPESKAFSFPEKNISKRKLSLIPTLPNLDDKIDSYRRAFKKDHSENLSKGLDKEHFNRMYGELERYFTLTNEHTFRDYEVPCKKIKVALTECLTSRIERPLSCGEEVTNFVACLLKCKSLKNV